MTMQPVAPGAVVARPARDQRMDVVKGVLQLSIFAKHVGLSFVGVAVTDREAKSGNSHNRVVGPDFQWRPSGTDVFSGQLLYSESRTPNRT